jgi:hypothetical protein
MVDCKLDRTSREVEGWVSITLENPGDAPLERFYLWLYPNRFAGETRGLDDVSRYWVYPRRHDPGGMRLERVTVEVAGGPAAVVGQGGWRAEPQAAAGRGVLWSIALPAPVAPGERVRVAARYRARIPERYGAFGCVDGQCTMAGGFYPMPAALDRTGWDLLAPPLRADTDVKVVLERPASIVLFDQWSGNDAAAFRVRVPAVRYATLVVAPAHFESARQVGGARIRTLSPEPPPPAPDAARVVLAYTLEDHGRFALDTAETALAVLADVDPALRPSALTMVVAPLRLELASAHERAVLVSDRFYRIWPAERFRKFHRRQLARAVYAAWLLRRRLRAGPLDRDQAADLAAAWLSDLFVLRRYQRREFIQNILRPVAFVPAIDQLLYAPQTMFADAYFGDAAPDSAGTAVRDDPRLFMHARPRGRFFYARLRDLLGDRKLAGALSAMTARGADLADSLAEQHGRPLGWFFRQWNQPPPRVNYRLVGHSARRDGDAFVNRVEVARETAAGDTPPVEPVEIRATDRDGTSHRLRWSGRTQRAAISYRSSSPVEWAWVDPDARLQQTSVLRPSQHARFDDRDRHQLRFVYNSFGVLLNVSDLSALLAADFSLSRVHDLENQLRFIAYASAAVRAGALISYRRGFGPEVTPDRLLGRAALTLGAARLDGDFFAGADAMPRDASQATLTASLGKDTEVFRFEPLAKQDARLAASFTLTRRDEVPGAAADVLASGDVLAVTSRTATPRLGHTVAGELSVAAAFGDIQSRTQLLTPGGADGVRGLAPGALFARAAATLRGEYRHTFVHDLDWNFGHYTFVRGIGGVAFVDAGLVSPCSGYLPEGGRDLFSAAGYGLQFMYDSFGTLQSLMRIDAAVGLSGSARPCLGEETTGGTTVQLYVTFLPPF